MEKRIIVPMNLLIVAGLFSLPLVLTGCSQSTGTSGQAEASQPSMMANTPQETAEITGKTGAALKEAAKDGKYLFVLFKKSENDATAEMRKVLENTLPKMDDRADLLEVDINDSEEKSVVGLYGMDRAPMPLLLAFAPSGAVMGGFPEKCDEEALLGVFGSPASEMTMKHLQDGKIVFVCVQNDKTTGNDGAMNGIKQFMADEKYGPYSQLVMLNPTDAKESSFLGDLRVPADTKTSVTVLLIPPGQAVSQFEGSIDKKAIETALTQSSCAPGASGCCP